MCKRIYSEIQYTLVLFRYCRCTGCLTYCTACHWLPNVPPPPQPIPLPIQWQKMMLLSTLRAESAFLFLGTLSEPYCRQPEKRKSDCSKEGENSSFWCHINLALLITPICCWARLLPEWLYSHSSDTQLVSHTHLLCRARHQRPTTTDTEQMSWPTSTDQSSVFWGKFTPRLCLRERLLCTK